MALIAGLTRQLRMAPHGPRSRGLRLLIRWSVVGAQPAIAARRSRELDEAVAQLLT